MGSFSAKNRALALAPLHRRLRLRVAGRGPGARWEKPSGIHRLPRRPLLRARREVQQAILPLDAAPGPRGCRARRGGLIGDLVFVLRPSGRSRRGREAPGKGATVWKTGRGAFPTRRSPTGDVIYFNRLSSTLFALDPAGIHYDRREEAVRTTVQDVHDLAGARHFRRDHRREGAPRISARSGASEFVFFRNPRKDALDPDTGERLTDVIVFWVEALHQKRRDGPRPPTPRRTSPPTISTATPPSSCVRRGSVTSSATSSRR